MLLQTVPSDIGASSAQEDLRQQPWVAHAIHSYDILGAGMLWKPKEARILTNFIDQPVNIW